MSLETATKISELVATNPQGTDPKSQGDDHLRMLKTVLKNNSIKSEIGQSGTPANNFTLDASADNGTMKLARESGQDIMTVDAAGKVGFPQNAQTWQDVTGSRTWGATYTNATGQSISVMATAQYAPGTNLSLSASVGGVVVGNIFVPSAITGAMAQTLFFTVPAGATYTISLAGDSTASWAELRN